MKLYFYGVRGTLPVPVDASRYASNIKKILLLYKKSKIKDIESFFNELPSDLSRITGGNTSATVLEPDDNFNEVVIIGAGSGLRKLGIKLADRMNLKINIILSHFHWDNICGIPFFKPLYNDTNSVTFYSSMPNIREALRKQQHISNSPLLFDNFSALTNFVHIDDNTKMNLGPLTIKSIPMFYPGGAYSYIIEEGKKKVSFAISASFSDHVLEKNYTFYKKEFRDSDVFIAGAPFIDNDLRQKSDVGNYSIEKIVHMASNFKVKKLLFLNYDPYQTESSIRELYKEAITEKQKLNSKIEIIRTHEGGFINV